MPKILQISNPRQSGKSAWDFAQLGTFLSPSSKPEEEQPEIIYVGELLKKLRTEFEVAQAPQGIVDKFEEQCKSLLQLAHNFSSHTKKKLSRNIVYETGIKESNELLWSTPPAHMSIHWDQTEPSETELAMKSQKNARDWKRSGFTDKFGEVRSLSKKILRGNSL